MPCVLVGSCNLHPIKIQKMANKRVKYKKITSELKQKLKLSFIQGEADANGFRSTPTLDKLAKDNQLSINTLYKLAQREDWKIQQEKFQHKYEEKLESTKLI